MTSPHNSRLEALDIAVLVPCYNEEIPIGNVVQDFKQALPSATIYVYDNASSDRTAEVAREAGAEVRYEPRKGKGNVVRRMFSDIEADIYLMVDGDDTYDASAAPMLINKLIDEHLDLVNGKRVQPASDAYRMGHKFGNVMLTSIVSSIFGRHFDDMLSGYKIFSRRYVKSFAAHSSGFEIETELTVHALEMRMPVAEVEVPYGARPEGSASKLSTIKDGVRILKTIGGLVKGERPLMFFSVLAALLGLGATVAGAPVMQTYFETGMVPRFPTAIMVMVMIMMAFLSTVCGLILDTVTKGRQEQKRMQYLSIPILTVPSTQQEEAQDD